MSTMIPPTAETEVTAAGPLDPAWDQARSQLAGLQATGRAYLYQQALFGWQLATLKKAHCRVGAGRPKKNSANLAEFLSWEEKLRAEVDLSRRTADRFIQLYDSTKAKLKRLISSEKKQDSEEEELSLSLLETANPLAIPAAQLEQVQHIVASLCDGLSQGALMAEIGVVPKSGGPGNDHEQPEEEAPLPPDQLAFHFFDGPASAIVKARTAADYHTLLNSLPLVAEEEGKVSLSFLRAEAAAFLADIEEVMAAHAKPAKGHTAATEDWS